MAPSESCEAIVVCATMFVIAVAKLREETGVKDLHARIGVHSGSVVAGVVGHTMVRGRCWDARAGAPPPPERLRAVAASSQSRLAASLPAVRPRGRHCASHGADISAGGMPCEPCCREGAAREFDVHAVRPMRGRQRVRAATGGDVAACVGKAARARACVLWWVCICNAHGYR